jgi:hypothetical protein
MANKQQEMIFDAEPIMLRRVRHSAHIEKSTVVSGLRHVTRDTISRTARYYSEKGAAYLLGAEGQIE